MDDVRSLARELVDVPNRLRRLEGRRHLEHSTVTVDGQEVPIPEAIRRIRTAETNLAATIQATADARAVADGEVDSFFGATAPASADEGDFWTDTDGNVHQRRSGSWQPVTSTTVQQAMNAASQAQSAADGKISTFLQATPPAAGGVGDLWIRSVDNRKHRWSGSQWVELKDAGITHAQTTADKKAKTFYRPTAPLAVESDDGDLWVRNADRRMHRYNGSTWVEVKDADIAAAQLAADAADVKAVAAQTAAQTAQSVADGKIDTFFSGTAPTAATEGDFWVNTADGNKVAVRRGTSWVPLTSQQGADAIAAAANAQAAADGKISTFLQAAAPTSAVLGDLWVRDSDKRLHRWDGTAWVAIVDKSIVLARSEAQAAQSKADAADVKAVAAQQSAQQAKDIADGKVDSFFAGTAPTSASEGDFWTNTSSGDVHQYRSGSWQPVTSAAVKQAMTAASQAQAAADGKITTFYSASAPTSAATGDLWVRDSDKRLHRWDGSAWVPIVDASIVTARNEAQAADAKAVAAQTSAADADAKAVAAAANAATAAASAAQAQATADGKMTVHRQTAAPTTASLGDLWIDTDDGHKTHSWDGTAWQPVSVTDAVKALQDASAAQTTANSKTTTYYGVAAPTSGHAKGDTWIRQSDKRTHYFDGSNWIAVVDGSIILARNEAQAADSKAVAAQSKADAADAKAVAAQQSAQQAKDIADGKVDSFFATTAPTTASEGDFWTNTTSGDVHQYRSSSWQPVTSAAVKQAMTAASQAQAAADGKITTYYAATGPASASAGDLWVRDSDKRLHRWDGSAWVPIVDASIVTARNEAQAADAKATTADGKAVQAKSVADSAKVDAANADSKAVQAKSTADTAKTIAEQAHADHDDAMSDGTNPLFRDYPVGAAAPTDWLPWSSGPTRTMVNGHPVPRFTTNATDNAGMSFSAAGVMKNISTRKQYLTIEVELTCHSGTFSGAGVRVDYGGMSGFRFALMPFKAFVPTPVAGQRYRLRSTIRFRPDASGTHTSWGGYLFSNYDSLSDYGAKSAKSFTLHRFAISTASEADIAALEARSLVDGKNAVRWATTNPVGNGISSGDVWYRKNASDDIVGIWRWDGTAWKTKTLANEVVSSLTADKLRTGTLTAGTVITAGPATGVHTTIKPEGITTFGADGKTELIQLGSGSQDRLAIADNASRIVSSINADGSASFKTVSVDDVLLNTADWTGSGGSLLELMDRRPRGVVAFGGRYTDSNASTGETPIYEVAFTAQKNRLYRISTSSHRVDSGAPDALMVIRLRMENSQWVAPDAPMFVASAPSTSSTILTEAIQSTGPDKITAMNVSKFHQFTTDSNVTNGHYQSHVRLLVSLVAFGSNTARLVANIQNGIASSPAEIVVEDIGPARGNYASIINQTNVPPTPPPQSHTLTRTASWVSSFRGNGSLRTDTSDAMQGQTPYYTPNGNHKSYVGFSDVTGDLNGSTVEKVEIYLYAGQTHYGSGGQGVIGTHGVAAKPSTAPAAVADRTRQHFNRGQGRWIDITGLGKDDWKTGATRGLALGPGPSTDPLYYIRFDGSSGNKPQLRITYRK